MIKGSSSCINVVSSPPCYSRYFIVIVCLWQLQSILYHYQSLANIPDNFSSINADSWYILLSFPVVITVTLV